MAKQRDAYCERFALDFSFWSAYGRDYRESGLIERGLLP
jgi:hypothetical protein